MSKIIDRSEGGKDIPWLKKGIVIFTILVYGVVIVLHEKEFDIEAPSFTLYQPLLHAILNGSTFLVLLFALFAIKQKKVELHKKLTSLGMLLSLVFLLSYVLYHTLAGSTTYGGDYSGLYYFILATHIILAGLSLPFILFAYYRGFIGDYTKHKKIVKFTYPVWLYVALTGVVVFLFLAPYY